MRERVLHVDALTSLIELDRQAGHSAATGQSQYARTQQNHQLTNSTLELEFFYVSTIWQQLLGTSLSIMTPLSLPVDLIKPKAAVKTSPPPQITKTSLHPQPKEAVALNEALVRMFEDDDAEFKSPEQLAAVHVVANSGPDLLWVCATGGGKTMAIELPAFLIRERAGPEVIVVITALRVLRHQLLTRFPGTTWLWDPRTERPPNAPVVIVPAERAATPGFDAWLGLTSVTRIVFDEAHLFLQAVRYRPILEEILQRAAAHPIPLLFTSATMPPHLITKLRTLVKGLHVLTGKVRRDNLRLETVELDSFTQSPDAIGELIVGGNLQGRRSVAVCWTPRECELLCEIITRRYAVQAVVYHGGLAEEAKERVLARWLNLELRTDLMICTGAGAVGVDVPNVAAVFHVGFARSLVDYVQEIGRAGRDGQWAVAYFLTYPDFIAMQSNKEELAEDEEIQQVRAYIDHKGCAWQYLTSYLTGLDAPCCLSLPNGVLLCRGCVRANTREEEEEEAGT
jgi:superfamily II DNA helicase RecQ